MIKGCKRQGGPRLQVLHIDSKAILHPKYTKLSKSKKIYKNVIDFIPLLPFLGSLTDAMGIGGFFNVSLIQDFWVWWNFLVAFLLPGILIVVIGLFNTVALATGSPNGALYDPKTRRSPL